MRAARYDAIVIGSRGAGAPTAMLLARRGYHTLVLDRAAGRNAAHSTQNLVQTGVVMLERWGLLDALLETGCPPATNTRVSVDGVTFEHPIVALDAIAHTFAPDGRVLDRILTDAARDAGAEVRFGHSVRSLVWDDGAVTGVVATNTEGSTFIAEAPIVVGADGARSFLARAVHARGYRRRTTGNTVHVALWHGVPEPATVEFAIMPGSAMAILPTHGANACVLVARPTADGPANGGTPESEYLATLGRVPAFEQRVLQGRRVSTLHSVADLPNLFRQPCGPGWALVGDAGLVKDPVPGRGMSDAFRQADRLAAAIDDGLSGRVAMPTTLAAFGAWRDETFGDVFETTVELARHPRSTDELAIRLLRHHQAIAVEHDQFTNTTRETPNEETPAASRSDDCAVDGGSPERGATARYRRAINPHHHGVEGDPRQRGGVLQALRR